MQIFNWKKRKQTSGNPLGLTDNQLRQIRLLRTDRKFDVFIGVLRDIAEYNAELLLSANDTTDLHKRQGYIGALREVVGLADRIIETADELEDARRRQSDTNGPNYSSLFGSPWWDVRQRLGRSGPAERPAAADHPDDG